MKLLDFNDLLIFHLVTKLVKLLGEMQQLLKNKVCTDVHAFQTMYASYFGDP